MTEPSLDVNINNVVQSVPALKKSRKDWDLVIAIYGHETIRIGVEDRRGVLGIQGHLVFECSQPASVILQETKVLGNEWTRFSNQPPDPDQQLPELAASGYRLFYKLFGDPEAQPFVAGLKEQIGAALKVQRRNSTEVPKPSLSIQIYTDSLYLPWELLYPSFDYKEYGSEGFFGFLFCLEQQPFGPVLKPISSKARWGASQPTEVSLQLDRTLEPDVRKPISSFLAGFSEAEIKSVERNTLAKLQEDLGRGVTDEIVYFCCHGYLQPIHIKLTCKKTLRPDDFMYFAKKPGFSTRPIVFLNTCNGVVTDSAFRTSFIDAFTRLGAVAVIGPQAEVRTQFALRFASDFLDGLFGGMTDAMSLGDIAYQVRVTAWRGGEPSGLLYSVYSLVPVFFQRRLNRRIGSQSTESDVLRAASSER